MPGPAPDDLVYLGALKAWLGITANNNSDDLLQALATAASRWVLSYISRASVLPATYSERYDGYGYSQTRLMLRNWPVTAVSLLMVDTCVIQAATPPSQSNQQAPSGYLLEQADQRPPGGPQNIDLYGNSFSRGRQNIRVDYTAGYMVAAEAAMIGSDGKLASSALRQPHGLWASDQGVVLADGTVLALVTGTPAAGQYSVAQDRTTGLATYTFNAAQASAAALFSYGYIPSDLAQAAMELAAERYSYKSRIGQASKHLGPEESITFTQSDMPAAMKLMLQNYKQVVPF